jgi:hypothetical protein
VRHQKRYRVTLSHATKRVYSQIGLRGQHALRIVMVAR